MPSFDCRSCGRSFSLAEDVLARYPGWTPRVCLRCRDAAGETEGAAQRGGGAAQRGGGAGRGGGGAGRGGGGAAQRGNGRRRRGAREEHLPVAEVLARYHGGPQDGVFTDGSADPNPGPGGWGAVYVVGGEVVAQDWGSEPHTTNNRMELTALIAGFELVPPGTPATVYTDSRLAHDTITKWAKGWEARGWRRKGGEIANLDLVKELHARAQARPELRLQWIAAHAGNRWNEYADALSTAYLREEI